MNSLHSARRQRSELILHLFWKRIEPTIQIEKSTATTDSNELASAVIGAESPAGSASLRAALRGINALMPKCRTIRLLGASAIMMPWVARGRLSAYWSPDECAWDLAAGALIVQEAGGIVSDLDGSPYKLQTRRILVSRSEGLHKDILKVLQEEAGIDLE